MFLYRYLISDFCTILFLTQKEKSDSIPLTHHPARGGYQELQCLTAMTVLPIKHLRMLAIPTSRLWYTVKLFPYRSP